MSASLRQQHMSPVDTAWLRMDSRGNLMMIVSVLLLDGTCDVPRLRKVIERQLLPYFQFRARAVQDATGFSWQEDPDFDLDRHFVVTRLPGRADKAELQKLVARLATRKLDPAHPLWQFHLVERFDGGHALITRIHHCIADGIALMGVLLSLTTADPHLPETAPAAARPHDDDDHAPWWDPWLRPFTHATVRALNVTGNVATKVLHAYGTLLNDPKTAGGAAGEYARIAAQVSKDAAAIALMDPDTPTRLKGVPGGKKVVAWNDPLPLDDVKTVGKALGCSVNDVLLSCVAGALRSYLLAHGEELAGAELRAMVPVNLRSPDSASTLGNRFGLVPMLLPIGIAHPIERVLEVRRRMRELKEGYQAVLAVALLGMAGLAPRLVQEQVLNMLARKGTVVMTNVPGPSEARYLAGRRMRQIMFWVPQSGDIGVGISVLSYTGGVQFGLMTDTHLCPDPQSIIDRFAPEFDKLLYAVLMAPWAEGGVADATRQERTPAAPAARQAHARAAGKPDRKPAAGKRNGTQSGAQRAKAPATQNEAAAVRPAGLRRRSAFALARRNLD